MRRLYFLIPDAEVAKSIVDELLLMHIPERQIHVVAKDHRLLQVNNIPEAGLLQKSELLPAIEKGVAAGGVAGLLAGLVAVSFPPAGLVLGGGAILGTSVAGAAFGAVVAPMIGISVPNSQLSQLEEALQVGGLLMIIDAPKLDVEKINQIIKTHHPEVDIRATEP